ncbi:ribbon-helix-helix protein domain-containing protein [Pseudomonas rhizosphaerae]|jgi:RHH-type rel operon transcriptional repressor/antitoxin RelB|uniref:Ribbon-helix-helix protein domain-containing protein n=1 Tax=Pseudomonas rhizosphaerae TaxID=216142 RepID=A0A089YXF9_9PSED|nr:ribbon-helix-helix protein, CopG family [Pseudomonas rhizosphaerae]AIS19092.1 ribbon-helix-helix protein domain-containing protein [Pseudomonas rhizosphaerae]
MSPMSFPIPDDMAESLSRLARDTGHSESFLVLQAMREYLQRESWQIEEIKDSLRELKAGNVASAEEVSALWKKWGNSAN